MWCPVRLCRLGPEVINQVGLMDNAYFVYAEESDWCYRIKKANWRCVFFRGANQSSRRGQQKYCYNKGIMEEAYRVKGVSIIGTAYNSFANAGAFTINPSTQL